MPKDFTKITAYTIKKFKGTVDKKGMSIQYLGKYFDIGYLENEHEKVCF